MSAKFVLWYAFLGCEAEQLRNGKKIRDACMRTIDLEIQGLVHRSANILAVPADDRMVADIRRRTASYPQAWHFQWLTWVRSILVIPHGFGPTRFAIGIYLPKTRELRICSKMRRISEGPFARRLADQDQQLFLIAERQISMRSGGIFGGIEASARQLPQQIDMY